MRLTIVRMDGIAGQSPPGEDRRRWCTGVGGIDDHRRRYEQRGHASDRGHVSESGGLLRSGPGRQGHNGWELERFLVCRGSYRCWFVAPGSDQLKLFGEWPRIVRRRGVVVVRADLSAAQEFSST